MTIHWKELSNLDIQQFQNLDYKKIFDELKKQPLLFFTVIFVLGTLVFCPHYFAKNQKLSLAVKQEILLLDEKNKAIEDYTAAKQKLQEFFKNVQQPLQEEELMNRIADFAVKDHVEIGSFAPSQDIDEPRFHASGIRLNLTAKEYRDLWLFIHELEINLPSTKISKLSITSLTDEPNKRSRGITQTPAPQSTESQLSIEMDLTSIRIKKSE